MKSEIFKIRFPAGYVTNDEVNDNLDMHVILENGKVFFATVLTVENIKYLMDKEHASYWWCEDMFIIRDLRKETIRAAVKKSIVDDYFKHIFYEIGPIEVVYGEEWSFNKITDMTLE